VVKILEINKIYNMDNIEGMRLLDDNSIDLTVTSPPYDNLRTYKGFSWDFEGIANELYRVTKDGGVVVWVVGDATIKGSETGTSFKQALYFKDIGFNLHDTMIYEKNGMAYPDTTRYYQVFEYMFVLSKGKPKTINLLSDRKNKWGGQYTFGNTSNRQVDGTLISKGKRKIKEYGVRFNIWRINGGKSYSTKDEIAYKHPAIFPEQLAQDHIISWSNEGDLVLDPFMGSGTTAKMAKLNNRNYIGFEISKDYCDIANKRIYDQEAQVNLFKL
jgi:DNA modification methylase